MITCNNCGKQVSAGATGANGATVCPFCGAPLVAKEGNASRQNDQEQTAIPAWLESLKASERPGTSASGSYNFSTSDLVDEDALPGWMRPDSAELAKKSDSNKYPAVRPSWMPAPNTDAASAGSGTPTDRLSAGSLIDSDALPSWMRPAPSSPAEPLSAASLVEPGSLPGWLTGPQSQIQQAYSPTPQAASFQGQPAFNTPNGPNAPVPPLPTQASPAYPMNQAGQVDRMQQGAWQQPAPLAPDANQAGISASSLLDMQALPEWMRTGGQPQSPSQFPSGSQPGQNSANGLTPGSLIDMDALPAWLRNADSPPQSGSYGSPIMQGNSGVYGSQGSQGTPGSLPRIENMRVPNRPRAEMAPLEQSEVAANVFSSMLGVASNPPAYPATPTGDYASMQQNFQARPYQHSPEPRFSAPSQGAPTGQGQTGPQAFSGMQQSPASATWNGQQEQQGQPGQPGNQGNQQGMYPNAQNGYASYPGAQSVGALSPQPSSQMYASPDASGMGQAGAGNAGLVQTGAAAGTKPARRGFFETIREWFHI